MTDTLQFDQIYHIYNRGNNRENLFYSAENYRYFLQLLGQHIAPIAHVYAYCLLPNHFHFLLQLKRKEVILADPDLTGFQKPVRSNRPHQYFSNFFNAYTKAFNKRYERTGALFQRPFSRILVDSPRYFNNLVIYIHRNPQKHGLVDDFRDWPWASYGAMVSTAPTKVHRDTVLEWFDGRSPFITAHATEPNTKLIAPLLIDES